MQLLLVTAVTALVFMQVLFQWHTVFNGNHTGICAVHGQQTHTDREGA
jgi:hypothetical protein